MIEKIPVSSLLAALGQTAAAQTDADTPEPGQLVEMVLPAVCEWYLAVEKDGKTTGRELTTQEKSSALQLDVIEPDSVRIVVVDAIPMPEDPLLASLYSLYGFDRGCSAKLDSSLSGISA